MPNEGTRCTTQVERAIANKRGAHAQRWLPKATRLPLSLRPNALALPNPGPSDLGLNTAGTQGSATHQPGESPKVAPPTAAHLTHDLAAGHVFCMQPPHAPTTLPIISEAFSTPKPQ